METVFLVLGTTIETFIGTMMKDPDGTGAGWVQWKYDGYQKEKTVIHSIHFNGLDAERAESNTPDTHSEERADPADQESPVVLTRITEYRVVQLFRGMDLDIPKGSLPSVHPWTW